MLSASQIIDLNQSNKLLSAFTELASDCEFSVKKKLLHCCSNVWGQ